MPVIGRRISIRTSIHTPRSVCTHESCLQRLHTTTQFSSDVRHFVLLTKFICCRVSQGKFWYLLPWRLQASRCMLVPMALTSEPCFRIARKAFPRSLVSIMNAITLCGSALCRGSWCSPGLSVCRLSCDFVQKLTENQDLNCELQITEASRLSKSPGLRYMEFPPCSCCT